MIGLFRKPVKQAARQESVPVAPFDKSRIVAFVDANDIAWAVWPGPPLELYQLIEVDAEGRTRHYSDRPSDGTTFEFTLRAASSHYQLAYAYTTTAQEPRGDDFDVLEVAAGAINALSDLGLIKGCEKLSPKVEIERLLRKALTLADAGQSNAAAHIAHALHLLDPAEPIPPPPEHVGPE